MRRYEIVDDQWLRIQDLLPGKQGDPGRSAADNRRRCPGQTPADYTYPRQDADINQARLLIGPYKPEVVIADKGYDSDALIAFIPSNGVEGRDPLFKTKP